MTHTNHLYVIVFAGSAILLLTAITLKPISGAPSLSPEHAVAISSHGTAAGEAALGNASVASPLSHSKSEV